VETTRFTLDTNVVYEIDAPGCSLALSRLVELGQSGVVRLQVAAISASERQRGGEHLGNFREFQARLSSLGLGDATILRPLAYIGISFIDWCLISGPELEALERAIHEILFVTPFRASDCCPSDDIDGRKGWRNRKCDVLGLWCHVYHGGDVFVTRDGNFFKATKKSRLEALGPFVIATPEEALAFIADDSSASDEHV
jgi:hypothetical protein